MAVIMDALIYTCVSMLQFKTGLAGKRLTELLTEDPPKVAIYGPGYSENVAMSAQISPYFNVTQVGSFVLRCCCFVWF